MGAWLWGGALVLPVYTCLAGWGPLTGPGGTFGGGVDRRAGPRGVATGLISLRDRHAGAVFARLQSSTNRTTYSKGPFWRAHGPGVVLHLRMLWMGLFFPVCGDMAHRYIQGLAAEERQTKQNRMCDPAVRWAIRSLINLFCSFWIPKISTLGEGMQERQQEPVTKPVHVFYPSFHRSLLLLPDQISVVWRVRNMDLTTANSRTEPET